LQRRTILVSEQRKENQFFSLFAETGKVIYYHPNKKCLKEEISLNHCSVIIVW
jgi:hypothetical protein